ncbi:MAG TPA: hemerythrin domain-containing protein [bacterium]|nr:hemerythrin domain-containing protein [bacterium]
MEQRADVFVGVHKGLRRGLLGLSQKLSSVDWADPQDVKAVEAEFKNMIYFLREHAENEDQIQAPTLEQKAPGATRQMAEDHHRLEKQIDQLEKDWEAAAKDAFPPELGYRLYLSYNRFLSAYLAHLDMEEGPITEAVYRHFTDEEIKAMVGRILAKTSPQDMGMMLSYMIPGMNAAERLSFLSGVKATAPAPVFEGLKGLAQKVLAPKDWEKLSAKLG